MNHDYEPLTKKRKLISTSRGNYKFSNGHLKLGKKLEPENDLQILAWLTAGCGQCCSRVPDEGSCCLLQHFKRNDNQYKFQDCCEVVKQCRSSIGRLDSLERETFLTEQFRDCIKSTIGSLDKRKFTMNYAVSVNMTASYSVCKKVFAYCWGISEYEIKAISKTLKIADGFVEGYTTRRFSDQTKLDFSINEAEGVFLRNQVSRETVGEPSLVAEAIDPEMVRAAIVPFSIPQRLCCEWLKNYFENFGDMSPNGKEIKLNQGKMKEQYNKYYLPDAQIELEGDEESPVSYNTFCLLWRVMYPQSTNRPYCSLPGHCKTCADIRAMQKTKMDKATQSYCTQAHLMHRGGLFMLERQGYSRRRLRAMSLENRRTKRILSFIIDLEDSAKTVLPYVDNIEVFGSQLDHHLAGVKVHGKGVTFYPIFDTVHKGANFSIFVILSEMEKFFKENGFWPEEVYAQIDGGSEFANKAVLAICELLVAKRMTRVLTLTRLPTGHTHEDIDAIFGVIWNHFHSQSVCLTIDDFKNGVKAAFKNSKLNVDFHDLVHQVPDYESFISTSTDPMLGTGFKNEKTMHQWRFEATERSTFFPNGCKTAYRKYDSDRVIELIPTPPQECLSEIGRHIGLEPVLLHSIWLPAANEIPGRPVEGFYILRDMPHAESGSLPPAAFHKEHPDTIVANLEKVRKCIRDSRMLSFTGHHASKREWWECFFKTFPINSDPFAYKVQCESLGIPFLEPCAKFIYDESYQSDAAARCKWMLPELGCGMEAILAGFSLPELLAVTGNSLTSTFNRNPAHPRLYSLRDLELQTMNNRFREAWTPIYAGLQQSNHLRNEFFPPILARKMSYDCISIDTAAGSARKTLLSCWEKYDLKFVTNVLHKLPPTDKRFIAGFIREPDDQRVLGSLGRSTAVVANDIKVIIGGNLLHSPAVLEKLLLLFQDRDAQISKNCQLNDPPLSWLPSLFFYSRNPYVDIPTKITTLAAVGYYRIYCLFKPVLGTSKLQLAIFDSSLKHVSLIGKVSQGSVFANSNFWATFQRKNPQYLTWTCDKSMARFDLIASLDDTFNRCRDEDLEEDLNIFKFKFAYWLAHGFLPK